MPTLPKRICRHAGCQVATHAPYCPAHAAEAAKADAWRGNTASASARGYGATWRRLRGMVLARDPVCKVCGREPSTAADHILPKSQGGENTLENLQGVCRGCHGRKTAAEGNTGRWGRRGATGGRRPRS